MMQLSLHQAWKFFEPRKQRWYAAQVPGCVHLDLLRHKLIPDPFWGDNERHLEWIEAKDWTYASEFQVSSALLAQENVDLVAEGLDTLASIRINGRLVAKTENMFTGYRFAVKPLLRLGKNRLEILFSSHIPYAQKKQKSRDWKGGFDEYGSASNIRKEQCAFGWDWGPRLVSSGIYRPLRLDAWSGNRIEHLGMTQVHGKKTVKLRLKPEFARKAAKGDRTRCKLWLDGRLVLESEALEFEVPDPQLWWPNGLGKQPLYDLEFELLRDGRVLDRCKKRLGLRSVVLDRHKDRWGESFQFKVNGLPIFAKGANWIPAHSFLPAATPAVQADLLDSAVAANMNMLRVWGGGVYESDEFYALCDERGLLVWQDFMFACAYYPGDKAFQGLVKTEARYQVRRLAHHACLALWCGNNELEQEPQNILATPKRKAAYDGIFYDILPKAVKRDGAAVAYWPSSPHNPRGYEKGHNNEKAGDAHFWDVWHARKPVKTYETKNFRFCSEFGMQSYSSPEVAKTFCPPEQMNVFSPAMESHQKNAAGNQIILDYISRLYRFPSDYASLAYLSQLNQAYCMKMGVEHFRRSMPRTMGALYWQLNDCWPVFSWSSLEFGGGWKALHHAARRFFAPALVSAHLPGDESVGISNQRRSSLHEVRLFSVYDGRETLKATLGWTLRHLHKGVLRRGSKVVVLRYGESRLQQKLDLKADMERWGAGNLVLQLTLKAGSRLLSESSVFVTAPRFLDLPQAAIKSSVRKRGPGHFEVAFASKAFQHQVHFGLGSLGQRDSDNYFDLYPGQTRRVSVRLEKDVSIPAFKRRLRVRTLADI